MNLQILKCSVQQHPSFYRG